MTNGGRKPLIDRYATVMIGVFCTLASATYVQQLYMQSPFHQAVRQAQVATTTANEASAQASTASTEAKVATNTATKAVHLATKVRNEDLSKCLQRQRETDDRVAALRRDVNQMKRRLSIP